MSRGRERGGESGEDAAAEEGVPVVQINAKGAYGVTGVEEGGQMQ